MSPARKKATSTRHAKAKRAAKRSRRRAGAKGARASGRAARRAARRAPKMHAAIVPAKGRPEGSAANRPSGAVKQDAPRPKLTVVARPAPRKPRRPAKVATPVEVSEFSGAKAGATAKDLALFRMERARIAVHAAIQGMGAGAADRPVAPGKWSPRQMVLHLAFWDREIVHKHLEAAAARNQRADIRRSRLDALNASGLAPLDHLDWEAAKRLLQTTHEALWDALDSIPAEPAEVWSPEHAVGELVQEVTEHDRHHADIIKRWRAEIGA